jgi:hypothetical protein
MSCYDEDDSRLTFDKDGLMRYFSPKRYIHSPLYFRGKSNSLVIAGNNSMLFATLDSLKHYGKDKYPKITFIYPSFWLDNIHHDYHNLHWGQTIYGLPKETREIFFKHRPNYPQDTFIKWHEYQEVREKVREDLFTNFNIEVHKKEPKTITKNNNEYWHIDFGANDGIKVPIDSFFYGWYRKPILTKEISNPHTKLYTVPMNDVPNPMLIVGHGLSLIWLLKHFPKHKIINMKNSIEEAPKVPSNSDIDIKEEIKKGRLEIYTSDKYELRTNKNGDVGNIIEINTGKMIFPISGVPIFAATGLKPEHNVFELIPKDQKLLMPLFDRHGLVAPTDDITKKLIQEDVFNAPMNLPLGSLAHSYTSLMYFTNNMSWTSEPMFYYKKNQYERLKNKAKDFGIGLDLQYFDEVDKSIIGLENPLNPEKSIELYFDAFIKIYSTTNLESSQFKQCLQEFFKLNDLTIQSNVPMHKIYSRRK